jgi:plastocyanin
VRRAVLKSQEGVHGANGTGPTARSTHRWNLAKENLVRIVRISVVLAVVALALAGVAVGSPAARTVNGTVGPGFTINLSQSGKKVTQLRAGVPYRFVIDDRAAIHDFHLSGPGVDKVITTVGFTGTKSIVLTLEKGTYRYVCDPHATVMKGSFKVV